MIKVVCGVIEYNDKIFICRRRKGKSLAGFWEFPGGKIEKGEVQEDSLKRELNEELGMTVRVTGFFGSNEHDYGDFKIQLFAYRCQFIKASFILTDHDKYAWIETEDLGRFKFAPADMPFVAKLITHELNS